MNVLPVKIMSLQASKVNDNIIVNWKAQNQENVVRYEVEKSADGRNFVNFAVQNTIGGEDYIATDSHPFAGVNYYRIKCINTDGSYLYSHVTKVTVTPIRDFTVSPNPVLANKNDDQPGQ